MKIKASNIFEKLSQLDVMSINLRKFDCIFRKCLRIIFLFVKSVAVFSEYQHEFGNLWKVD